MTALPVTQADRDLAHEILHRVRGFAVNIPHDQHWLIQHVARHRTNAEPRPVAGLDGRCGFNAGSVLDAPKSAEWMAACELLAQQFDRWNMKGHAKQVRAGHPAWLIEQACIEAIVAVTLSPAPTSLEGGKTAELVEAFGALLATPPASDTGAGLRDEMQQIVLICEQAAYACASCSKECGPVKAVNEIHAAVTAALATDATLTHDILLTPRPG